MSGGRGEVGREFAAWIHPMMGRCGVGVSLQSLDGACRLFVVPGSQSPSAEGSDVFGESHDEGGGPNVA